MISENDLNLAQIELSRLQPAAGHELAQNQGALPPMELAHQLESFAAMTRNIESSLAKERTYSTQLREYCGKLTAQIHDLRRTGESLRNQLDAIAQKDGLAAENLRSLTAEFKRVQDELNRYRKAWGAVIQREREAGSILSESGKNRARLEQAESQLRGVHQQWLQEKTQREQAERHAKSYQSELQSILVRLHTSEARFSELEKEMRAQNSLRKNHEMEFQRKEEALRSRFHTEAMAEKQGLITQLDQQWSGRLEKACSEARRLAHEKAWRDCEAGLAAELKAKLAAAESAYGQEIQKLKVEFTKCLDEERTQAQKAVECSQRGAQEERARNSASLGAAETELISVRKELVDAQRWINELKGVVAQKHSDLTQKQSELDQKHVEINQKHIESTQKHAELNQKQVELAQLQAGSVQMKAELGRMQTESERKQAELALMQDKLAQMRTESAQMQAEIDQKKTESENFQSESALNELELAGAHSELENTRIALTHSDADTALAHERILSLKKECETLRTVLKQEKQNAKSLLVGIQAGFEMGPSDLCLDARVFRELSTQADVPILNSASEPSLEAAAEMPPAPPGIPKTRPRLH